MTSPMPPLPVDRILDDLRRALHENSAVVLQAPPGSGKTTRVPLALRDAAWLKGRRIVMLEPRRLAATNAARFMAQLCNEPVGRTVGFAIRYARQISRETQVEVVTEGLLTRRLQTDPELSEIGLVIFDEFHERNLQADLALALCRDIQQGLREDLRILVMSATLDVQPLAKLLDDCPVVTATGRSFPVSVNYQAGRGRLSLAENTVAGIRRALTETRGDILAFLPGAGEIRRCQELLKDQADRVDLRPLFSNLPFADQERAILPGPRRRVVLATNIAETSLTIEGVETVVDSGWERRPRFDAARGMTALETVRISQASAEQRAGRAGRLAPGTCYRLWKEGDQGALLPQTPPEISQADLTALAFELLRWGVEPEALDWLDPPPRGHYLAARQLLHQLGAIDEKARLTRVGARMADFPAHPRVARLLCAATAAQVPGLGAELAALLSEPDVIRRDGNGPPAGTRCDLLDRLEALRGGLEQNRAFKRAVRYWRKHLRVGGSEPGGFLEIGRLLALAYPDRLARQRRAGSDHYLLRDGQGARLSDRTGVRDAEWLVAVELEKGRDGEGLIHQASALERADVEELFEQAATWQQELSWDETGQRISAREKYCIDALPLQTRPVDLSPEALGSFLLETIRREGLGTLSWSKSARQLRARVQLMRSAFPEDDWPDWSEQALLATLEEWLAPWLLGVSSRAALRSVDLEQILSTSLGHQLRSTLDRCAPPRLQVPSGARPRIDYTQGDVPVLAVKLQEMFGLATSPRIAEGRVALQIHLLSPAGRPLAVTADLASFWDAVYPEVRREMKGRYPKHPWPEDPWQAEATGKPKPRKRK